MVESAASRTARPTVLFVGTGEPMDEALVAAMERHGVDVERAVVESAAGAARAAAPDLVLLAGDAATGAGAKVLAQLATSPLTQVVPVALLAAESALDARLEAFRHGVVAVIPRSASADEIARRVASLARELPERAGEASGDLGEATLDELMALVKSELKTGILSVEPKVPGVTEGSGAFRLVLGAGKPVAKAVEEFVAQLRPLVSKAEPLRWEFHETAASRLHSIDPGGEREDGDLAVFDGLRVLLVVLDPVRADALATELRARGATVGVTDASGRGLDRARTLDAEVVVLDAAGLEGRGFEVVRAMRRDHRLRWASMLIAHWDELWPEGAAAPDMKRLAGRIAPLVETDRALVERARHEPSFDTRLEVVGPSRLVRALVHAGRTIHVTVRNPRAIVELDIAEGLVVGVSATREGHPSEPLEGTTALAALLALASGRVRVEWRERPAVANVMAPVDEALSAGAAESPPIPASLPPPNMLGALGAQVGSEPPIPRPSRPVTVEEEEVPTGEVRAAAVAAARDGTLPAATFEDAPTTARDLAPAEATATEEAAPEVAASAPAMPAKRAAKATLVGVGLGPPTAPRPAPPKGGPGPRPGPRIVAVYASPATLASPAAPSAAVVQQPARPVGGAAALRAAPAPLEVEPTRPAVVVPDAQPPEPSPPVIAPLPAIAVSAAPGASEPTHGRPVTLGAITLDTHPGRPSDRPIAADGFMIQNASALEEPLPLPSETTAIEPRPKRSPLLFVVVGIVVVLLLVTAGAAALVVPRLLAGSSHQVNAVPLGTGDGVHSVALVVDAGGASVVAVVDAGAVVVPGAVDAGLVTPPPPVADAGTIVVAPAAVDAGIVVAASAEVDAGTAAPDELDAGVLDEAFDPLAVGDDHDDTPHRPANVEAANFLTIRAARLVATGDLRDAEVLYLRALREDRHNPHALAGLASLHLARHASRDALRYAQAAVAVRPGRAAYRVILGDAFAQSGRRTDAVTQWREALRLDSHNATARARLHGR